MEKGVRRWLVDISKWNPSRDEFSFLISLFPSHDQSSISRFVKFEDRKRAIVSRLLQYALVNEVLGIPFNEIIIRRTIEGKPYLESVKDLLEFPNFNFNVSHHGDYVGIASEPLCLVGLDIISYFIPRQEPPFEYLVNFSPYLSWLEWDSIINAGTSDRMLGEFYRYWCLKEAFVKAIGAGVGYKLDRLEFHHTHWSNISVHIDGEESTEWKFSLFELEGKQHYVSVAKGHPRMAIDSYKRTLKHKEFDHDEYNLGLQLPNPSFESRTIDQLIPDSHSVTYNIHFCISKHEIAIEVTNAPRRLIEILYDEGTDEAIAALHMFIHCLTTCSTLILGCFHGRKKGGG